MAYVQIFGIPFIWKSISLNFWEISENSSFQYVICRESCKKKKKGTGRLLTGSLELSTWEQDAWGFYDHLLQLMYEHSRRKQGRLGDFSNILCLLPRYVSQVFKSLLTDHQCCWVKNQYVFPPRTISALDQKLQPLVNCPSVPHPRGTLGQRPGI